jgi:capsular exopolysaccharide synthesis family protein
VDWLQAQAEAQRKDVESKDAAILVFRQANQLDALEGQRKSVDEGLVQINSTLVAAESRLAQENELLETIGKTELSPELAGKLPGSIPRAAEVDAAIEKWKRAVNEREAMLAVYTPEHPAVVSRTRIVELEHAQALESLARAKATAEANSGLLARQVTGFRKIMEEQQALSGSLELKIVERKIRLEALARARDASDNAYRGLLTRIQEARLAADENTATVKMVSDAMVPGTPVSPRVTVVLGVALLIGLAVGGVLAFVIDSLEDYVASPEDVEKASGLPVLAVLPHMKAKTRVAVARATLDKGTAPLVEAFAGLRSMLDASQYKGRSQVILMLSSLPGEGKTVAACNLASAFAHSGQKTLLIDFDLRRPRLDGIFPMPKDALSLADALDGKSETYSLEQLVYDGGTPNLAVVAGRPGGTTAPVDLVASRRAAELVAWARTRYDRIVLDAPPVGLVSDGFVLAGMSDMVLLVTRVDASRRQAISHTLRRLYDMGVTTAAAVVGDVNFARRYYGKAAYYHYQNGYTSTSKAEASS